MNISKEYLTSKVKSHFLYNDIKSFNFFSLEKSFSTLNDTSVKEISKLLKEFFKKGVVYSRSIGPDILKGIVIIQLLLSHLSGSVWFNGIE